MQCKWGLLSFCRRKKWNISISRAHSQRYLSRDEWPNYIRLQSLSIIQKWCAHIDLKHSATVSLHDEVPNENSKCIHFHLIWMQYRFYSFNIQIGTNRACAAHLLHDVQPTANAYYKITSELRISFKFMIATKTISIFYSPICSKINRQEPIPLHRHTVSSN